KLPGVFSSGELDDGTRFLLENIPFNKTKILDIACGAGVIGAIYNKLAPKNDVTMSDSSILAVKASEETVKKNNLDAKVLLSDVFSSVDGTFDLILSNPPFHTGVETDYSFIERFARDAKKHLNRGGEVYVVANSFLPYEETLGKYIGPAETVVNDGTFKVIRATRP
ncbi:MAG: methyltransferase, partial [Patescibacteria group bacterium]|nr:methyltransferase [Patescibacteria group bacterium]